MYEKQVFKDGVRVVTECGNVSSARYFSKDETSELFKVGPAGTLVGSLTDNLVLLQSFVNNLLSCVRAYHHLLFLLISFSHRYSYYCNHDRPFVGDGAALGILRE